MSLSTWKKVSVAAVLCCSSMALAAAPPIIAARQAGFKELGRNFKVINDGIRAGSVTPAMKASAKAVSKGSKDIPRWFPKGSGPSAGKTKAKATIWEDPTGFAAKSRAFAGEAGKLEAAIMRGDVAAAKVAAKGVGQQCGVCHAGYREKD